MEFLGHTLMWQWCRDHGFPLDEPARPIGPRLADDPALIHRDRVVNDVAGDSARARALAEKLSAALGVWEECLVWATEWDVWTYEEDWPRYYAWRGRFGERRSLEAASGHVFESADAALLQELLAHVLQCGWDVTVLPSAGGLSTGRRLRTSHDGWVEFQSVSPIALSVAAG
jgi:hypothetical protein